MLETRFQGLRGGIDKKSPAEAANISVIVAMDIV
jgi:hypothetical protein